MIRGAAAILLPLAALTAALGMPAQAQSPLSSQLQARIKAIEPKVVAWRRDIHQHPELGNREVRTAKLVAEHLRALGIEVQTGVAHTGSSDYCAVGGRDRLCFSAPTWMRF